MAGIDGAGFSFAGPDSAKVDRCSRLAVGDDHVHGPAVVIWFRVGESDFDDADSSF